jgi:hypothetical protein
MAVRAFTIWRIGRSLPPVPPVPVAPSVRATPSPAVAAAVQVSYLHARPHDLSRHVFELRVSSAWFEYRMVFSASAWFEYRMGVQCMTLGQGITGAAAVKRRVVPP